jgi:hypothetical protein
MGSLHLQIGRNVSLLIANHKGEVAGLSYICFRVLVQVKMHLPLELRIYGKIMVRGHVNYQTMYYSRTIRNIKTGIVSRMI